MQYLPLSCVLGIRPKKVSVMKVLAPMGADKYGKTKQNSTSLEEKSHQFDLAS